MKCSTARSLGRFLPFFGLLLMCASAVAQRAPSKPIDLDRELRRDVTPDRAASYYHYSLAKLNENKGNMGVALSEMETALDYNPNSSLLHLELAFLCEKNAKPREAIEHAEEAARLDPQAPDPHWFLANVYYPQDGSPAGGSMAKAIQELEKVRELAPKDERSYRALGDAYFRLNQPDKAIEVLEQYQTLTKSTDIGYQTIAKYYFDKGNLQKALEYCLKALELQPESVETLLLQTQIYSKQNKEKDAVPIYRKLLELVGSNSQFSSAIKQQLATSLIEADESKEAVDLLKELTQANPQNLRAYILLGRAQIELRQFSEAMDTLQSVLKSDPDSKEAVFYMAVVHERKREFAESIKIFTSLLNSPAVNPEEAKANRLLFLQHLAMNYEQLREPKKVIAAYQDMVKVEPNAVPGLIDAYRVDRQFDKALLLGKQSFEKSPEDIRVAIAYARTLSDTGKSKEGADILLKLLASNSSNIDIYLYLSAIYMQDKRYAEAEKLLRGANDQKFEGDADKERLKLQLATVYEKQKSFDRAESLIKEILKSKPDNAEALNYIGYMLADRGVRLDEAVKYVKEALTIDPRNGAFLDSLGWALFKLNDLGNAEKYLLEADSIVKDDPTIVDHLGDLYFKTGDFNKAQDFWLKSIQLGTEQEDTEKVRHKLDSLQDKLRKKK
jgi:tetratricopeptide (TPR) repeat protein